MNEIVQGYISTVLTERATGAPSPYDPDTSMSRSFLPYRGTTPASSPAAAAIAAAFSERDDAVYRGDLVVTGIGTDVMDRFVGLPRGVSAAISGTGLGPFAALGAAMSSKNLTRIQEKQRAGEEGYAIGMLNGRIVGVSPGLFGGYALSGVLPEGISVKQRQSIAQQLLEMSGPRFQPDEGIGGPAADNPDLKTGRTYSETAFGAGTYEGGTIPPDSIGPSAFVMDTPTAGDRGNDPSSIRFINTGADRPDPNYHGDVTRGAFFDPSLNTIDYYGDPGGDTGLAPTGGATTPRDDSDRGQPRNEYSIGGGGSSNPADRGYSMMADGGAVQGTGFVSGSPDNYTKAQTVADDENRQVREGAFVLNAPTTEKLQKAGLLPTGVDNSDKNSTIKASKGGLMDVALSKGEYVIEPEEAQRIGYSFLEQLNNGGKAEVDRRQAMNDGGIAGTDLSGMPPLAAGLRPPVRTDSKPEGFLAISPEMPDNPIPRDVINGIDLENVGRAISLVETRGYEDRNDGYFYTRSDTRKNPSSAFGPLQITGDTLAAMIKEFNELRIQMNEDINPGFAEYIDKFATDARNRTNYRKSGKLYTGERGKKAIGRKATPEEAKMYQNLGTGSISLEDHKKYYPLLGKLYLRYKAGMSTSEEDMVRRHFGNTKSTQKYRDAKAELGIN